MNDVTSEGVGTRRSTMGLTQMLKRKASWRQRDPERRKTKKEEAKANEATDVKQMTNAADRHMDSQMTDEIKEVR